MSNDETLLAYIQGTLSPKDRAEFEALASQDADLTAEIAALGATRRVLAQQPSDMPANGWARLSEAIDATAASPAPSPANENRPLRLSILQAACIAGLAVVGWQFFESTVLTPQDAAYLPASISQPDAQLQVAFDPQATQGDITEFLGTIGATIIEGPSAIGLYRLGFVDAEARDAGFERLSARDDLADEVLKN